MVYNIEKMLKEHRDKVSAADAKAVEEALEETKKAMQEGGIDQDQPGHFQARNRQPQTGRSDVQSLQPARRRTPPQARPGGDGNGAGAGEAKPKDNVVDAEFVDVDDKK